MRNRLYFCIYVLTIITFSFMSAGCAINFYKQSPKNKEKIKNLNEEISGLKEQQAMEREKFEEVKRMLEKKLKSEIDDENVSLEMNESGLVIILSDNILFDSGKAAIKDDADSVLDKVSKIIRQKVPDKNIGVSGHTDNVPITHSKWKSNWELSTARATNVLHALVERGVSPKKLSATGYGEHRQRASNDTEDGRMENRRVEILILPEFQKVKKDFNTNADEGDYLK